jgi:cell division protein ZapA
MERNRVVVSIFGKEYSLVADVDPEYIKKTAQYLDAKMREVSENYPNITEARVAVLAALNIADELIKLRNSQIDLTQVEQQLGELTRRLSETL